MDSLKIDVAGRPRLADPLDADLLSAMITIGFELPPSPADGVAGWPPNWRAELSRLLA